MSSPFFSNRHVGGCAGQIINEYKNIMEQQIKLAAKLYRCRDTAKCFFGEEFKEKILPYQQVISGVAKEKNIRETKSLNK